MKPRDPAPVQRNALAPSLIAAAVLFLSPILPAGSWKLVALFATAILALIIGWFAFRARQWAWVLIFGAIAVLWNPRAAVPVLRHRLGHRSTRRRTGVPRRGRRDQDEAPVSIRRAAAVAGAVLLFVLTGCAANGPLTEQYRGGNEKGYIAGNFQVVEIPPCRARRPGHLRRENRARRDRFQQRL